MVVIYLSEEVSSALQSKSEFDMVGEMKKPSARTEGLQDKQPDLAETKSDSGQVNNPTISHPLNLYKQSSISVSNNESIQYQGFFSFPRSVSSSPKYKGAKLKYKHVLHTLFEKAVYEPTTHTIGPIEIDIKVGQYCVTVRGLMDLCNQGVKHQEDLVDKNIIERSIAFWVKCGFVRQEVRHGKTIITITVREFYKKGEYPYETGCETLPRQDRDTKVTREQNKERKQQQSESASPPVCSAEAEEKEKATNELVSLVLSSPKKMPFTETQIRSLCKTFTPEKVQEKLSWYVEDYLRKGKQGNNPISLLTAALNNDYQI